MSESLLYMQPENILSLIGNRVPICSTKITDYFGIPVIKEKFSDLQEVYGAWFQLPHGNTVVAAATLERGVLNFRVQDNLPEYYSNYIIARLIAFCCLYGDKLPYVECRYLYRMNYYVDSLLSKSSISIALDKFVGSLLLPTELLQDLWNSRYDHNYASLAESMDVPNSIMYQRILELNLSGKDT